MRCVSCASVKQYKATLLDILAFPKKLDDKNLKNGEFLKDGMWKCTENSGIGARSIGEIKQ
ncbi:MAG TPA: hypothetical protein DCE56_04665 [Cyanobacteria bacterium UBA8553]|nr:hypothetical protein [Cyanobacteria bacterium UBA8553]